MCRAKQVIEMKSTIEIFTSPTCPHCPSAKTLAEEVGKEREDVTVLIRSSATPEGVARAQQFQIMSVPTIIITGPATEEVFGHQGTPSKPRLNELIDMSLGKKAIPVREEKKGFFKKLFG